MYIFKRRNDAIENSAISDKDRRGNPFNFILFIFFVMAPGLFHRYLLYSHFMILTHRGRGIIFLVYYICLRQIVYK